MADGNVDGRIVFYTGLDNSELEKKLQQTKKEIAGLTDKVFDQKAKKNLLLEQMEQLNQELETAKASYHELVAQTKGKTDVDSSGTIAAQVGIVDKLAADMERTQAEIEKCDQKISNFETDIAVAESRAGSLEQAIAQTGNEAGTAAEQATAMSGALSSASIAASAMRVAFSIVEKTFHALVTTAKQIMTTVAKVAATAVKGFVKVTKTVATAVSKMNVFQKISEKIGPLFKRIGNLISRAFVFSTITSGLRYLKQTISSYLKTNAEFSQALSNVKGALLTAFQPIYNAVVPALTAMLNILTKIISAIASFTASLFGSTAKAAQSNAKALYGQAKATEAAGGAADKAKKQLAAFDEINQLTDNSESGGGGTSDSIAPSFDLDMEEQQYQTWGEAFDAFLDKIISSLPKLDEALQAAATKINDFSQKLLEMFTFPGVADKVALIGVELAASLNNFVNNVDWHQLGQAIGAGLNLAITFAVSFLYTFDWLNFGAQIAEFINGAVEQIDWKQVGQLLWSGFKIAIETLAGLLLNLDMTLLGGAISDFATGFFDSVSETLTQIDWYAIGEQLKILILNIDWGSIAESAANALGAAFGAVTGIIWGLIEDAWNDVVDWWHDVAYEDGEFTIQGLLDGISDVLSDIYNWIKEHIFQPFIDGFKKAFGIASPSKVMKEMGGYLLEGLLNGITDGWEDLKEWFNNTIKPKLTLEYWKEQFGNIAEGLTAKIKDGINVGIDLFNEFIDFINSKMTISWSSFSLLGKEIIPAGSFTLLTIPNIPRLAQGAVIPPNREFMAVLGDQTSGYNIEAPEGLIRQIVREEVGGTGDLLREILSAIREGKTMVCDNVQLAKVVQKSVSNASRASGTPVKVW